jgi:hypothetical protein
LTGGFFAQIGYVAVVLGKKTLIRSANDELNLPNTVARIFTFSLCQLDPDYLVLLLDVTLCFGSRL